MNNHNETVAKIERFLEVRLTSDFALNADPTNHFDRSYLTEDDDRRIRELVDLDAYRNFLIESESGSISLQYL